MPDKYFFKIILFCIFLIFTLPLNIRGQFEPEDDNKKVVPKEEKEIELKNNDLAIIDSRLNEQLEASNVLIKDLPLLSFLNSCASGLYDKNETNGRTIQVKVINSPQLNAVSLFDGTIYVNLAILGLIENEAQLAFLLAHEIAHISQDHHKAFKYEMHLQALHASQGQIAGSIFGIGIPTGHFAQTALCGFSRNQEFEADSIALRKIIRKGYNGWKAKDLLSTMYTWINYKEKNIAEERATHPQLSDRLQKIISIIGASDTVSGVDGAARYQSIVSPFYGKIIDLLLVSNSSKELYELCLRMISLNSSLTEWQYLRGRILERHSPIDSFSVAYQSLRNALGYDPEFSKAFREAGWLFLKNNKKDSAAVYLKKYLSVNPGASDLSIIQFYLKNIL